MKKIVMVLGLSPCVLQQNFLKLIVRVEDPNSNSTFNHFSVHAIHKFVQIYPNSIFDVVPMLFLPESEKNEFSSPN